VYEELLANDDFEIAREFFESRGMLNLLGEDRESCEATLDMILKGWVGLKITDAGKMLSHIMRGIRLAFSCGAGLKVSLTSSGEYGGFILYGGSFRVIVSGKEYTPQPFATVQAAYEHANPHDGALKELYEMIQFPTDIERVSQKTKATSMFNVGEDLRKYSFSDDNREKIVNCAKLLSFPRDKYLPVNSPSIVKVFGAIAGTSGDSEIPLHYSALLEKSRTRRLLSGFGAMGPSFRVEGGRVMDLTGNFAINVKTKTGKMEVSIVKMFCQVVPLEKCWSDFEEMVAKKNVMTPAGTQMASRVSSRSTIREFEGPQGAEILASIRRACQISVAGVASTSGTKRKADDDAGGAAKKGKISLGF
jgi:hypothetical protein